ncbi:MAG: hypothetical protein IJX63_06870 [Lachnospiraceae bacterium]|nr:hypothetical protein [Lachnospiraceae bacterium]
MKIWISKRSIFWVLCMIAGVVFLIRGIVEHEKYYDAIDITQLDTTKYESGTYVSGEITEFQKARPVGFEKYTGCYMELDYYDVYLVPVSNGDYVQFMVKYQETKELLERAANYNTDPISFTGIIIEEGDYSPYSYGHNGGFDTSHVVSDFLVQQVSPRKMNNTTYLGIDLIIIGLLMSLTGFSGEAFIVDESEKEKKKRRPIKSYNVENDIHSKQKKLAMLELQKLAMQKDFRTNAFFLAGSLLFILIVPVEIKVFGTLPAIFAAKGCFMYWLHQPNPTAKLFAGIFGVTPIHKRITECEEMIEKLEKSKVKDEPIIMLEPSEDLAELEERE